MSELPTDLAHRLRSHGQEHVLLGWEQLSSIEQSDLVQQLSGIDLTQLEQLYTQREETFTLPGADRISPMPVEGPESIDASMIAQGEAALRAGQVAALIVAGGQGSRLGFEHPKGMFPVGPISNATLFQIHAEKVLAISRRYGRPMPLLIMTSPATHAETIDYFEKEQFFGLPKEQVQFFQQGTMPALNVQTGRLLLERRGVIFNSPNGHGGTLTALNETGLLNDLKNHGIRQIFYFQVDNPLVRIGDPALLGLHIARLAEVSVKVIDKNDPNEKMGVFALVDGKLAIIEYIDMPAQLNELLGKDGKLVYRAANPAIHLFDVEFLERVTRGPSSLPFHVAKKRVPCLDASGNPIDPLEPNALKFEMFIFDALPMAKRWVALRSTRREEFAPLKNGEGADSPKTVKQGLLDLASDWLNECGIKVKVPVEISPLFALDATELKAKLPTNFNPTNETYLK